MLLSILYFFRSVGDLFFTCEEHAILAYHSISDLDGRDENVISTQKFRQQLALLKKAGYSFVSISDVVGWFYGRKNLPKKTVTVTFDDGYKNFLTKALPIMQEFDCPSTIFIIEDRYETPYELLNEEDVDMLRGLKNVTVGFHTRTHPDLRILRGESLKRECVSDRVEYKFFAYPGGNYSDDSIAIAARNYQAAFSIKPELVTRKSDPYILPRIVVTSAMSDNNLLMMVSMASTWYRKLRRAVLYVARKN